MLGICTDRAVPCGCLNILDTGGRGGHGRAVPPGTGRRLPAGGRVPARKMATVSFVMLTRSCSGGSVPAGQPEQASVTQCQRSRREQRSRPDESLHRAGMTLMRLPMTATGDAAPAPGQPDPRAGRLAWLRHAPALARQHWLFAVLLTAGLVLRVLTQIAYRPALLYIDSTKYLLGAYPGDDPPGYQLAIKPVLALGNPDLIAVIQHLAGLGMAIALYLVLLRRGAPRWLARPGHRPGPAGRLPAADRAERHARRHVRGADRGRPGRPAVADRPVTLAGRGGGPGPWRLRHRPADRRDLHPPRGRPGCCS